jgi:hypothetical protein
VPQYDDHHGTDKEQDSQDDDLRVGKVASEPVANEVHDTAFSMDCERVTWIEHDFFSGQEGLPASV